MALYPPCPASRRRWLTALLGGVVGSVLAAAGGCAGTPAPPHSHGVADARAAAADPDALERWTVAQVNTLGTPTWLLLGEQHDADAHQALAAAAVRVLAARGALAAVVLEMAERGHDTGALPRTADEDTVRGALAWNDAGWPWQRYGPVVMAAVRAGVPVHGGNLPRTRHRAVMADPGWDRLLAPDWLEALRWLMDTSHCGMLPASQWSPMARIQIARDDSLAETLWALRSPGRTVLLVTGAQHARRTQGVPVHLARRAGSPVAPPALQVVELRATDAPLRALDGPDEDADAVWLTPAVPPVDHCAGLRPAR